MAVLVAAAVAVVAVVVVVVYVVVAVPGNAAEWTTSVGGSGTLPNGHSLGFGTAIDSKCVHDAELSITLSQGCCTVG